MPAEGGGWCGGQGGSRWPPGTGLAGVVLLMVAAGQWQERARARGGWPEEARAAAVAARWAWAGGWRGRMGQVPVGALAAASIRWVCGSGKDGGLVRAVAETEARAWWADAGHDGRGMASRRAVAERGGGGRVGRGSANLSRV
jgi:hypothetical protein